MAVVWVLSGMNSKLSVVYPTIIVSYIAGFIATGMFPAEKAAA